MSSKQNSGELSSELTINCNDDAKGAVHCPPHPKSTSPGSLSAKSPVLASNVSSSVSNDSADDDDASSKKNCDTGFGQVSDGANPNALLSGDANKSRKKGKHIVYSFSKDGLLL